MTDIHSLGFLELEIGDYLVNWCLVIHYSQSFKESKP